MRVQIEPMLRILIVFRNATRFTTFYIHLDFADDEDPVISGMPSAISQSTDATVATAVVTWTPPTASDNSGTYTLTSSHNSGDNFNLGATTVTYTAADAAGNTVMDTFTVTITGKHKIRALIEMKRYENDVREIMSFHSKIVKHHSKG